MNIRRLLALATITAAAAGLGSASPSMAEGVNDLPAVTEAELRDSVHDIEIQVFDVEIDNSIQGVEVLEKEGTETVVTLTSDILFAFGKAALPTTAATRITSLVAKAPKGGTLTVGGHTDDVGATARNLTLSKARAAAVAAVVATARPDLTLTVAGFGESKPVATNEAGGKDNPAGRAENRRVELRYQG